MLAAAVAAAGPDDHARARAVLDAAGRRRAVGRPARLPPGEPRGSTSRCSHRPGCGGSRRWSSSAWNLTESYRPMARLTEDAPLRLHADHREMLAAFVARDAAGPAGLRRRPPRPPARRDRDPAPRGGAVRRRARDRENPCTHRDQPEHDGVDDPADRRVGAGGRRAGDDGRGGHPGHGPGLHREPLRRGAQRARPARRDRPAQAGRARRRRVRDRLLRRPRLDAARELADGPVVGIAEAAMHAASFLGRGFSVVTTLGRTAGRAWDLAERYGMTRFCRNVRRVRDPRAGAGGPGVGRVRGDRRRGAAGGGRRRRRRRSCWAAPGWPTSRRG